MSLLSDLVRSSLSTFSCPSFSIRRFLTVSLKPKFKETPFVVAVTTCELEGVDSIRGDPISNDFTWAARILVLVMTCPGISYH